MKHYMFLTPNIKKVHLYGKDVLMVWGGLMLVGRTDLLVFQ